ncbi:MAG: hypothetical protein ACRD8U_12165 [Pyrinomonadaceae bacterium]
MACLILLVAIGTAACSYETNRRIQTAVALSVDRFHEQLNSRQFHDIYSQSDLELQNRISEDEFSAQLAAAHEQLGVSTDKAIVIIDDSVWRGLRRAFSNRERVFHGNLVTSDSVIAHEKFVWAVENFEPKLVSYEFRFVCSKPCSIGFAR